jgi:NTE family protein
MKLGISLSGGGIRAMVFHFGVLKRLAESKHWDSIEHLSTVSGGSLCVALIFAKNSGKWPTSDQFLNTVLPAAREQLTKHSLMCASIRSGFLRPDLLLGGRAHLVARVLTKKWGLTMNLQDLPERPRWTINCTTYETGKNWRFSHKRMGDYRTGYVLKPSFPVADAAAASAGFPGGIGPRKIKTKNYQWFNYKKGSRTEMESCQPLHKRYHLWDGGVYENLGSEALVKPDIGFREGLDFYIASDPGKPLSLGTARFSWKLPFYLPPGRLLDCAMDQIRAIRSRTINRIVSPTGSRRCGVYFQMGLDQHELTNFFCEAVEGALPGMTLLRPEVARFARKYPTNLRRMKPENFDILFNHGYDVADVTIGVSAGDEFPPEAKFT